MSTRTARRQRTAERRGTGRSRALVHTFAGSPARSEGLLFSFATTDTWNLTDNAIFWQSPGGSSGGIAHDHYGGGTIDPPYNPE